MSDPLDDLANAVYGRGAHVAEYIDGETILKDAAARVRELKAACEDAVAAMYDGYYGGGDGDNSILAKPYALSVIRHLEATIAKPDFTNEVST